MPVCASIDLIVNAIFLFLEGPKADPSQADSDPADFERAIIATGE